MKPQIIVTGGAGYIGSHVAKELFHHGFEPVVIDNLCTGHQKFVKWGPFYSCDIRNTSELVRIFKHHQPSAVMHLAGSALVGESVQNPMKYYENNVVGALSLLKAMQNANCHKLVFSSSCAIYGQYNETLITEDLPAKPINPYGQSKWMVEQMISDVCRTGVMSCISLRYFNAAGSDPQYEIGEERESETHLIPLAIKAALNKTPRLQVWGNDYPTKDGTCVRDYIHVSDIASAHLLALMKLMKKPLASFQPYNLGTGNGYSVHEVIRMVEKITAEKVPYIYKPRRAGDPAILIASGERARKELNWTPRYADLATMIQHAVSWYQQRGNHAGHENTVFN